MRQRSAYAAIYAAGVLVGLLAGRCAPVLLGLAFPALLLAPMLVRRPRREELMADGKAFTVAQSLWFAGIFAALLAFSLGQARWALGDDATAFDSLSTPFRVLGVNYLALAVSLPG